MPATVKKTWNPSSWGQRAFLSCLAGLAALMALSMALFQWGLTVNIWDPVFKEQTRQVLQSEVSHNLWQWARIPDAALGCVAYLADIIFALAGSKHRWYDRPWIVFIFAVNVIPLGIASAVLVSLQGTVVNAWCFMCLLTAVISLTLVILGYSETRYCVLYLWKVWKKSRDRRLLWNTFWGRPSETAYQVMKKMEAEHVG
jgi:uncharacterized membrane protein